MNPSPEIGRRDHKENKGADDSMALQFCAIPRAHIGPDQARGKPSDGEALITKDVQDQFLRTTTASPASANSNSAQHDPPHPIHKHLTLNIADHSQAELITMLSSLLSKITYSNDNIHSGPEPIAPLKPNSPLLAFHARNIPSISIQSYLTRILKYCPMSSDIFLSLLVYFDRMSHNPASEDKPARDFSTFTSTRQLIGEEEHPLSIDSYNVHRLVITGIVVASKFCSDVFYTNSRYAKVGGLPLSELNHLEFQFLLMNDFRLMIPMEELQKYGDQLLNFWHNETANRSREG